MKDTSKILITGASRGIGEAIAHQFASPNRELILVARTETDLARITNDLKKQGKKASYYLCDLSDKESVRTVFTKIKNDHPDITHLILNAGVSTNSSFLEHNMESIEKEMRINYFSPLEITKIFLPDLIARKEGSIVSIGSMVANLPFPGNSSYAASKAALFSFFRSLGMEVQKHNVFVGSVLPGLTKTDMTKEFHSTLLPFDSPEDVARAVEYSIDTRTPIVIPGFLNNTISGIYRMIPEPLNALIENFADFLVPMSKPNRI